MVNAPLSDTLYARFSGVAELRDGPYEEAITGIDYGNRRVFAGRGALRLFLVTNSRLTLHSTTLIDRNVARAALASGITGGVSRPCMKSLRESLSGTHAMVLGIPWGTGAFASDVDGESITENYGVIAHSLVDSAEQRGSSMTESSRS